MQAERRLLVVRLVSFHCGPPLSAGAHPLRRHPRAEIEAAPIHRPWLALRSKDMLNKFFGHPAPHEDEVKNPVRTNDVRWRERGASSIEKAIDIWG